MRAKRRPVIAPSPSTPLSPFPSGRAGDCLMIKRSRGARGFARVCRQRATSSAQGEWDAMRIRSLVLNLMLGALAVTPALAQDKEVQLKISLWVPPAHPLVPATKEWADDIEKASGGSIKSVIFPSEQLGKAFDHYDMARDGIADVTYVNPGYQPGRFPVVALGQIPFIFADGRK